LFFDLSGRKVRVLLRREVVFVRLRADAGGSVLEEAEGVPDEDEEELMELERVVVEERDRALRKRSVIAMSTKVFVLLGSCALSCKVSRLG
jgi:hypothetical protein